MLTVYSVVSIKRTGMGGGGKNFFIYYIKNKYRVGKKVFSS